MTHGLRIRPAADADVDAAAFFIANDSLDAALRFLDAINQTYQTIRENPKRYQRYELDHGRLVGLRKRSVTGFPDFLVFFVLDGDMVEIVRVLHGARDVGTVLADEK